MSEISKSLRFAIFKRDFFRCQYCGKSSDQGAILHVDHVTPLSMGGTNDPKNLVTACADCNLGKGPHPGPKGDGVIPNTRASRLNAYSKGSAGIVGKFFHSRVNGKIHWQGRIVSEVAAGRYLVELASWLDGYPTEQRVVTLEEMADWNFYNTARSMRWAAAQEFHWSVEDFEAGERYIEEMCKERAR